MIRYVAAQTMMRTAAAQRPPMPGRYEPLLSLVSDPRLPKAFKPSQAHEAIPIIIPRASSIAVSFLA
jgi:hypothetical protein